MYLLKHLSLLVLFVLLSGLFKSSAADKKDSLKNIIYSSAPYKERIKALFEFGEKYSFDDFDETLTIGAEGIRMAKNMKDPAAEGNIKRYVGVAYYFKGNYTEAAKYYYESISLLENTNQLRNLALAYNELAKLYRKTRILDRALANYDKALNLFTTLKDSAGISMIQNESGVVFEYKNDLNEAIARYSRSYDIALAMKDNIGVSYALSNLASVYTIQKKYTKAESLLKEALELRRHLSDSLALCLMYSEVGANYFSQKKHSNALLFLDSSNLIAISINYPEIQAHNYKMLSDISKESGDFQLAFNFLERRTNLHDSLIDVSKLKQIEELNNKYENLKKEKVIQQQQFEINKRNYWIIAVIIFLILASIAAFSFYKKTQLKQKATIQQAIFFQQEIATKAILEAEENERQRIAKDLHDGIGQMMSVAKMNLSALETNLQFANEKQQNSYGTIIKLVDESCREVRNVSHNMMPNALLNNNLAEALRTFSNQLDHPELNIQLYTQGLDNKMNGNMETILYRVIQECVNNVIKHAEASVLDISVIKDEDGISATIEDNGAGFDSSGEVLVEGIGLKNIRSRILFLKGTVEFVSSPGAGTLVSLHIPNS